MPTAALESTREALGPSPPLRTRRAPAPPRRPAPSAPPPPPRAAVPSPPPRPPPPLLGEPRDVPHLVLREQVGGHLGNPDRPRHGGDIAGVVPREERHAG